MLLCRDSSLSDVDSWKGVRMSDLTKLPLGSLLGLHREIMEELRHRGVSRSSNNPTGSQAASRSSCFAVPSPGNWRRIQRRGTMPKMAVAKSMRSRAASFIVATSRGNFH